MGLWQSILDSLPWNRRHREQVHAERKKELLDATYEPLPPVASAAEAMADMRRRSAANAPSAPTSEAPESPGGPRKPLPGSGRAGNEALRDFARKKGV